MVHPHMMAVPANCIRPLLPLGFTPAHREKSLTRILTATVERNGCRIQVNDAMRTKAYLMVIPYIIVHDTTKDTFLLSRRIAPGSRLYEPFRAALAGVMLEGECLEQAACRILSDAIGVDMMDTPNMELLGFLRTDDGTAEEAALCAVYRAQVRKPCYDSRNENRLRTCWVSKDQIGRLFERRKLEHRSQCVFQYAMNIREDAVCN